VAGLGRVSLATRILVGEPRLQPHDSILEHARRIRADLIVLGNRGQNVTERLLLGSTADRVLRMSPVPVLLVPGPASRGSRSDRR
jgi:nucleotide-binding universal stress UspA family protein